MTVATEGVEPSVEGRGGRHPLDPLNRGEIEQAAAIVRAWPYFTPRMIFVRMELFEPPKSEVLSYPTSGPIDREAFVILLDPREAATYEAVLSLTEGSVRSWKHVPGVQPPITNLEYERLAELVRSDPRFREALQKRGVDNVDLVTIEGWTMGGFERPEERARRLVWTLCWARDFEGDNQYAHPIEGLYAIVDLNAMEIVRIEDGTPIPVPKAEANYTPEAVGVMRDDLKPLDVVQPDGASFQLEGWEMRWQKWRFRIGFTPREGLVFHTVGYEDNGRVRPIVYRASVAELVIPYGDPSPSGFRRNAFDIGEYGVGAYTNSLQLGCDCVGLIRYLDVDLCDNLGNPYTLQNAICIHEEDAGLLWKHYDAISGHTEVRRSRRLVVSSIVTVDNYEYCFYWYFYQDGSIEVEAKLTGIVVTSALAPGEEPRYGRRVAPDLIAPNHQHFFTARLDMMVDGMENTVCEVHSESPPPGTENPYGGAIVSVATPLRWESEAQQTIDPTSARIWRIENPSVPNHVGEPVAYKLIPGGDGVLPFIRESSPLYRRLGFLRKHLWVTPYDRSERYPGGEYPNQHPDGDGLPVWTRQDRPIEGTDIVVWYNFVNHHISRPEDWPVMPVVRVGFTLKPDGFFDRNPALDVPPPSHCHHDSKEMER